MRRSGSNGRSPASQPTCAEGNSAQPARSNVATRRTSARMPNPWTEVHGYHRRSLTRPSLFGNPTISLKNSFTALPVGAVVPQNPFGWLVLVPYSGKPSNFSTRAAGSLWLNRLNCMLQKRAIPQATVTDRGIFIRTNSSSSPSHSSVTTGDADLYSSLTGSVQPIRP